MKIFRKKDLKTISQTSTPLKRVFKTRDLVFLGIGAIIGTGVFVLTGKGALIAGPALSFSFVIAALCCFFTGLCYAEFTSIAPVSGSAYSYAYISYGEIIAFIIGWNSLLQYTLGAATVAVGWSGYFSDLLSRFGFSIPASLTSALTAGGKGQLFNFPAFLIVLILTFIIALGINQTKNLNNWMVFIKLGVIIVFICLTVSFVKFSNWQPFSPFGWYSHYHGQAKGIIPGASIVFFSFIGFDTVAASAEEAINPKKTLPRGILWSLLIVTGIYVVMTLVMTGVIKYQTFSHYLSAPFLAVIKKTGQSWLMILVSLGIIVGITTVIMAILYTQTRVSYTMAKDGLLPKFLGKINLKYQTPFKGTWFYGLLTAFSAGLINLNILAELANIATLATFIVVSGGIIWLRHTRPDIYRGFRAPAVPFVPLISMIFSLILMAGLNRQTWYEFIIWILIGLIVYFGYSKNHSNLYR